MNKYLFCYSQILQGLRDTLATKTPKNAGSVITNFFIQCIAKFARKQGKFLRASNVVGNYTGTRSKHCLEAFARSLELGFNSNAHIIFGASQMDRW